MAYHKQRGVGTKGHEPWSEKWEGVADEKFPRESAKEQAIQFYLDSSQQI